jgi:trimeric autotransporter adhesin
MSTKTLRKRIALATVVALGAGVLSLVSTTAAQASSNSASGTVGPAAAAGVLNIGTKTPSNGAATTSANAFDNASLGLLSVGDLGSTTTAATTQTAALLSSGALVVYTTVGVTGSNRTAVITVTGGTIVSGTFAAATTSTAPAPGGDTSMLQSFNSGRTTVVTSRTAASAGTSGYNAVAYAILPNAGATQMIVQMYTAGDVAYTASQFLGTPSLGTLAGQITVTVGATSTSGTVSATQSAIYYTAVGASSATADTTSPITGQPYVGSTAYSVTQGAVARIRDAYTAAIGSGALIQATATNGAFVSLAIGANNTVPTASSAYVTSDGTSIYYGINVKATVSTASSTAVTVTVNGTPIGTKTFNFYGKVAKVTLSNAGNGVRTTTSGTTMTAPGNYATVALADSAGNTLYLGSAAMGNPNATSAYNLLSTGLTSDALTTGVSLGATKNSPGDGTPTSAGSVLFTCSAAVNVSGQLVVDYTNIDGSVVTSNALPASCSGSPYTYTAAFDKSTYKPGDIATLSVTFKDSAGALAADVYTLNADGSVASTALSASGATPSITASNLTPTSGTSTNAATTTDVTTNGVVKYVFTVGTTTGAYQALVNFPNVRSASGQAVVNVPYTIADGSTSLNDVLKGIVALIASINKQIAALAKLVAPAKKK